MADASIRVSVQREGGSVWGVGGCVMGFENGLLGGTGWHTRLVENPKVCMHAFVSLF